MEIKEKIHYHNSLGNVFKNKEYIVPIYRYISFDNLLQLLRSKTLWISQTKLWDDTYENFLAKAKHQWGPTPISYKGFLPGFYGQCWTLKKETDAMWRIYSYDKTGVRIKSSIKKVLEASLNEFHLKPYSTRIRTIGIVNYLNPKKIRDWVENKNQRIINDIALTESLFIKRTEFSHEKEVRLIIHKNNNQKDEINHIKIQIQPNEFIEEITFDPRLDNEKYLSYKMAVENMGFTNRINKSKLYDFEQLIISK